MKIRVLNNQVVLPEVQSELSAGVDLRITSFKKLFKGCKEINVDKLQRSIDSGYFTLRGHERVLCGTNLFIEIPKGTHLAIVPRSGVTLERGLTVINSPGTIDADYRDEICIIIVNTTPYLNKLTLGERIAQAILLEHHPIEWELRDALDEIDRGGGFGHTGTK